CKLSGMITEADFDNWTPADLSRYVERVVGAFGPGRCMFGSDWPVCLLAGSYDQVIEALDANLGRLTAAEREGVFGGVAASFYGLESVS
ncbi:MAG: amidohydrolase family protein, partial [Bradyrhizobium sp.]|nr:amidohydrolase family protein [Bradyrhizobium sp.]